MIFVFLYDVTLSMSFGYPVPNVVVIHTHYCSYLDLDFVMIFQIWISGNLNLKFVGRSEYVLSLILT